MRPSPPGPSELRAPARRLPDRTSARHPAAPGLRTVFLALLLAVLPPPRATAQCHYTWIQLPRAGSLFTYGRAINNLGWVTGIATAGGEYDRGFIWRPDTGVSVLIPLPPGAAAIAPYDINDHGHVVGTMEVPGTGLGRVPFWWDGEQVHAIQLPPGTRNGWAYAINNRGQVVGQFEIIGGNVHAFLWEAGVFTDIGVNLPATSMAHDINELGHVCGNVIFPGFVPHAFRIRGGEFEWLPIPAGFAMSSAHGLNNNGTVVGTTWAIAPSYWGVVWSQDGVDWVDDAQANEERSAFQAVNDAGRAVGDIVPPVGVRRTIAWQFGSIQVLNTMYDPPLPPTTALDINASGSLVAIIIGGTVVLHPQWLPGDLTGDCRVTLDDLMLVLTNFGSPAGTYPRGDADLDGDVDLHDLTTVLAHWGQ